MLGLGLSLTQRSTFGTGGGSGGPVTDAIVQSINANSWSFTASGTPPTFAPDSSPQFAYVTRAGFNGGSPTFFIDTIVLTRRLRQPAPNDATLTTDQGVLSDYIYSTDTVTGKTVNGTETSPKPIATWALADRQTVGNTISTAVVAAHRDGRAGKPVDCVVFRATDGVNTVQQTVLAPTILGHTGDKNAVIGYPVDLDISTLTAGVITVNAKVYPVVGGAASVLDSAAQSNEYEFSPRTYVKSATGPQYVYVVSGGNDTTGVLSTSRTTAKATPCATYAGACTRARALNGTVLDNVVIVLGAGAWELTANNLTGTWNTNAEVIIERDPDVPFSDVTYRFGANFSTRFTWCRWRNLKLARTAGSIGLLSTRAVIENDELDNNSVAAAILANGTVYVQGLTVTGGTTTLFGAGTAANCLLRGISGSGLFMEDRAILGCSVTASQPKGSSTRGQSGCFVGFNKLMGCGGINPWWQVASVADVVGYAAIQNVVEWSTTGTNAAYRPSGDGDPGSMTHFVDWHNTFVGFGSYGRHNFGYDESPGTTRRTQKLCTLVGPIISQLNNKTDKWVHYNNANADAPNRIGAWPLAMGVGCRGVFTQFAAPSVNEAQDYPGLNASIGTSTTVRNDPLFVDYKAVTSGPTAGAGGGDYHLQSGSPCAGRVKASPLPFDLDGNPRNAAASASGAYRGFAEAA